MKLLLLAESYPPVLNSGARLFAELAKSLEQHGHQVRVLTLAPDRYTIGEPPGKTYGPLSRRDEFGVDVWRVRRPSFHRGTSVLRGLEQLISGFILFAVGSSMSRREAVIAYSPPLPIAFAGYVLAALWRGKTIINVQDLYPETAVALGAMKNPLLIRLYAAAARFLYRHTDWVTVHSEGNRLRVVDLVPTARVRTVPNWIDLALPTLIGAQFRTAHGLDGKFVISYAGIMGLGQGLEDVIDAADVLRYRPEIVFVLAGEGSMRKRVEEESRTRSLGNVRLLPMLGREQYQSLMQASNACLVTLNKDLRLPVVPGKLASIMAAGRAAVCSVPAESDVWPIIHESEAGICVRAGRGGELAATILQLSLDRRRVEDMGRRGREYAEREFSRERCVAVYLGLLEDRSK